MGKCHMVEILNALQTAEYCIICNQRQRESWFKKIEFQEHIHYCRAGVTKLWPVDGTLLCLMERLEHEML